MLAVQGICAYIQKLLIGFLIPPLFFSRFLKAVPIVQRDVSSTSVYGLSRFSGKS